MKNIAALLKRYKSSRTWCKILLQIFPIDITNPTFEKAINVWCWVMLHIFSYKNPRISYNNSPKGIHLLVIIILLHESVY